jgi:5-(carboxyamino)imidazole ribonucleotide mutase
MPPGVPVATVAINGAKNAGILAAQMLGIADTNVAQRVNDFKQAQEKEVLAKAVTLEEKGYQKYLEA